MHKVAAKRAEGQFPDDLKAEPCGLCRRTVVMCGRVDKRGAGRYAVELAPKGVPGNVAIQLSLLACAPTTSPCAYETETATAYRWHQCPGSFVGQARPRKVRL